VETSVSFTDVTV